MTEHFPGYSIVHGNLRFTFDPSRLNKNLDRAQWLLDNQIMTDMVPLMPFVEGTFINVTRSRSASLAGTGTVVAAATLYGRFLYYGKVMVDPDTGSSWTHHGGKKVVTDRPLHYSRPGAVPEWFEVAKARHMQEWVSLVERTLKEG